jgi:hypothetical protein
MKKCGLDCWVIVFVTFFLLFMITCSGCKTTYEPPDYYLQQYTESRIEYSANNNKEDLMEAGRNWNLYWKARAYELNNN